MKTGSRRRDFLGLAYMGAAALFFGLGYPALAGEEAAQKTRVIEVTARQFEFIPKEIRLKKGVPVTLEVRTLDVLHGFDCPGLGFRADVRPGMVTKISFTPDNAGTFEFFCDIFCGKGHAKMVGRFIVEE